MSENSLPSSIAPLELNTAGGSKLYLLSALVLTSMAGGMGWGIRGQYGHETGAMIAGVLVGFTLVLFFLPRASSLKAARVVALIAAGIAFGGSMTYGQTVGLTHDKELIGHWAALGWGLLGLFVKGGLWIGFAGAFLGMGLSAKRYRPLEMAMLMPTLLVLVIAGTFALNWPFDPKNFMLPYIYFSDHWHWEPDAVLKPRREIWGGLLFALLGLMYYVHFVRKDRLALNMALVGILAGGIGFSGGQSVQAFHAWNPEMFTKDALGNLYPYVIKINWWNMMEMSFGAIFGFVLALGLWLNRHLIDHDETSADKKTNEEPEIPPAWEFVLCPVHVFLLLGYGFLGIRMLFLYEMFGLVMCAIPLVAIVGGRYWPYLFALPIVAVPIAGKTLLELSYKRDGDKILEKVQVVAPAELGWICFVAVPLAVALLVALYLAYLGKRGQTSRQFARVGLLFTTWLYFGLNFAFFRNPWPWAEAEKWTGRTPSVIIMAVCAVMLTAGVAFIGSKPKKA